MNARFRLRLGATLVLAHSLVCLSPARAHSTNVNDNVALDRAMSVSRQFVAYAPGSLLASTMCVFAERVKHQWLLLLDTKDNWRDPIILVVREREPSERETPTVRLEVFQNEIHLKYQITCLMPPQLDQPSMTAAIVQMLCAEQANRDLETTIAKPTILAPPPPWLVHGFAQSINGQSDVLLAVARRSVEAGRPQSASDLLNTSSLPADPAEQQLFRANARLLTEGLLSLPDGARKMQQFLAELGATKSASNAFAAVYGTDFPKPVTLEKWWSVQQVSRSLALVARDLSAGETSRRLDKILQTTLVERRGKEDKGTAKEVSLDQLRNYYEQPWMGELLQGKLNSLETLRSEAHPLYRPVIEAYIEAVNLLMVQKLSRFRRAMEAADRERATVDQRTKQIADVLDRAERVYASEDVSNQFAGYFQILDKIQSLDEKRHNPISDYLDKFDK